jgi:hypothetical protein
MEMRHIQIGRLETTSVDPNPFDHVIVPSFLGLETVHAVNDTFPNSKSGGSHILKDYGPGATISDVIAELDGPEFEEAIENKVQYIAFAVSQTVLAQGAYARPGRAHSYGLEGQNCYRPSLPQSRLALRVRTAPAIAQRHKS